MKSKRMLSFDERKTPCGFVQLMPTQWRSRRFASWHVAARLEVPLDCFLHRLSLKVVFGVLCVDVMLEKRVNIARPAFSRDKSVQPCESRPLFLRFLCCHWHLKHRDRRRTYQRGPPHP